MNDVILYKYLTRVAYLKVIFIKLALSTFVTFLLNPDYGTSAYPMTIIIFYLLSSLYHIGLRLFSNYLLAILSPIGFLLLIMYINDLNSLDKISMDQSNFFVILLALSPFIYDLYILGYVLVRKFKFLKQQI